jgi:hypothetical protein
MSQGCAVTDTETFYRVGDRPDEAGSALVN